MQEVVYDVHMKKLCVVNRALVVKEKFLKYKNILVENQTTITTKINVLTMMYSWSTINGNFYCTIDEVLFDELT